MEDGITLDLEANSEGDYIYYPGQVLKASITLSLNKILKIKAFYVKIFGKSKAYWTEKNGRSESKLTNSSQMTSELGQNFKAVMANRCAEVHLFAAKVFLKCHESYAVCGLPSRCPVAQKRLATTALKESNYITAHYEGKEIFINSRNYIIGKAEGSKFKLDPGNHKYSFSCQLPNDLPYSIKLDHGEIVYFVETVLVIPWSYNLELRKDFGIARHEDLNIHPELRLPLSRDIVKKFFTLFKESKPLQMSVSIPRSGYTSNQEVLVNILYSNQSDVDIKKTAVRLLKCLIFTSQSPQKVKIEKIRLNSKLVPGVAAGRSRGIEIVVPIPAIKLTSNRRFSQVVTIEYAIEVEGDADGFHSNPIVYVPIIIGDVPLRFDDDRNSSSFIQSSALPPDYSSPPTFEEAMRLRGNGDSTCNIE